MTKTLEQLVNESANPVFVDFYADWCAPCRSIAPSIQRLAGEFGGKLTVVKIDVDKQPAAAARYQVQGVPALLLFRNGTVAWRSSGAMPYESIRSEVVKALGWE